MIRIRFLIEDSPFVPVQLRGQPRRAELAVQLRAIPGGFRAAAPTRSEAIERLLQVARSTARRHGLSLPDWYCGCLAGASLPELVQLEHAFVREEPVRRGVIEYVTRVDGAEKSGS